MNISSRVDDGIGPSIIRTRTHPQKMFPTKDIQDLLPALRVTWHPRHVVERWNKIIVIMWRTRAEEGSIHDLSPHGLDGR